MTGTNDLTLRVIPCLDVTDGRVVKGVEFVNLRDAGDPVEMAAIYNREGADELVFLDITASSDSRSTMVDVVAPYRRPGLHPADRRRRHPHGRGYPGAAQCRRRQDLDQHRRPCPTRTGQRGSRHLRHPVHHRRDRRPPASRQASWEVYTHGGRRSTGIDVVEWARPGGRTWRRGNPAHQHGPRRHPCRVRPPPAGGGRGGGQYPGDRLRRGGHDSSTSPRRCNRAAPTPCLPPPSSISVRCVSPRSRQYLHGEGLPVRSGAPANEYACPADPVRRRMD